MNIHNNVLSDITIITDMALWKLLLHGMKKSHKLSRVEAFYDLIDRHCIALLKGEDEHISGTTHSLAKVWGWDRETVAKFLDSLEQLGTVTIDMVNKRKTIRMNGVRFRKTTPETIHHPSNESSTASNTT